jgi:PAS domain S-box-containing protein
VSEEQEGGSEWELAEAIKLMGDAQASGDPEQIATAMRRHAEALTNATNTVMIPTLKNVLETVVRKEVGALARELNQTRIVQDEHFGYMLSQMGAFLEKEDARHSVYDASEASTLATLTSVAHRLDEITSYVQQSVTLAREGIKVGREALAIGRAAQETGIKALSIGEEALSVAKAGAARLGKITRDVTLLKKAMVDSQEDRADLRQRIDAISTSQAVFTASMLLSAHAVIVIDPTQIIVSVNQKVLKYFGYADDELVGHPLDILIPERFRAVHRKHIEAFAQSSDTQRLMADRHEVFGLHKDRSEFLIRAAIVKISDGFIAVIERVGDGNR